MPQECGAAWRFGVPILLPYILRFPPSQRRHNTVRSIHRKLESVISQSIGASQNSLQMAFPIYFSYLQLKAVEASIQSLAEMGGSTTILSSFTELDLQVL